MIPFSGGGAATFSGARRHPPPLAAAAASSSSSLLSPLAPPFTVDRPLPSDPNLHAPTAPGLYSLPPPSAAAAASSPRLAPPSAGYRFGAGADVVEADPYYPPYSPSSKCSSEPLPGFDGFWRVGLSPWERPLEGERSRGGDESSSWIDPSPSYQFSPFYGVAAAAAAAAAAAVVAEGSRASEDPLVQSGKYANSFASENRFQPESSQWLDEKYLPTYGFGSSFLDSSSLSNRIPSSSSLEPPRAAETGKKFNSNSTYDYYVSQLASSSTDTMSYKPPAASLTLNQLYDQAGETISSTDCGISEAGFSAVKHANPCRINLDYFDYVSDGQKESKIHETMESNYSYWSIGANNMKRDNSATIDSLPVKGCYTASNDSVHGIQVSSTQLKHNFSTGEPYNSEQISSESLDQQNLSVDSPCWKGAPSSHHYPSDMGVKEHSDKFAKDLSSFSDLQQCLKNLQATIKFVETPSTSYDGSSTCKDKPNDPFPVEYSSAVKLHGKCQQSVDGKDANSRCAEAGIKKADHSTDIPEKPANGTMKYVNTDSELEGCVIQLNEDEKVSSTNNKVMANDLIYPEITQQEAAQDSLSDPSDDRDKTKKVSPSEFAIPCKKPKVVDSSDIAGNCSDPVEDIPLLIASLHNLSRMLLSSSKNEYKLKGSDHKLLQSVIENLKAYTAKIENVELKAEDGAKVSNNRCSPEMKATIDPIVCAENEDKPIHSIPGIVDTDLRKSILQALEKLPEDSSFAQKGDAHTPLYKNLWIEAEVALCSMKYELARLKLKMESAKHRQNVNSGDSSDDVKPSDEVTRLTSLNSMKIPSSIFRSSTLETEGGGGSSNRRPQDEVDVSVMARCGVLKGRVDNINTSGESSYELPQEVNEERLDEADAAVMARLKVLKARIDHSNPDCEDEHPSETKETVCIFLSDNENSTKPKYCPKEFDECNIKKADEVDASIIARLDALKGQPDAVNSLGASNYNQNSKLTAKREDEVDASVMARLRILRGRSDNSNPDCGDENQELCRFSNLDSVPQNQQTHGDADQQSVSSAVNDRSNIDCLNTAYSEERGIWPNYSWLAATCGTPATAAVPLFGSYFSDSHQGRQAFVGDSSNTSLEWEHVSKEELSSSNSS